MQLHQSSRVVVKKGSNASSEIWQRMQSTRSDIGQGLQSIENTKFGLKLIDSKLSNGVNMGKKVANFDH